MSERDFLKQISLKEDGSNFEAWLFKLKNVYKTKKLVNSLDLKIHPNGEDQDEILNNPLTNRTHWKFVSMAGR